MRSGFSSKRPTSYIYLCGYLFGQQGDAWKTWEKTTQILIFIVNCTFNPYGTKALERHQIPISDREIQRIVLGSLSSRFPHETSMHAYKGECDLKDLGTGLARVEKFRSDQIKKGASPHALAAAYTGSGGAGTGGGTRGRGKRSGRR